MTPSEARTSPWRRPAGLAAMFVVILWAGSLASPAAAKSVRSSGPCPPKLCPPLPPDGDGDGDKPSKGEPKKATFKLSLHGEQAFATSYDNVHEALYPGDESYSCHDEASEHVSFATPQPLKVTVKRRRYSGHPRDYILWFAFGPGGPLQGLGVEEAGWGDPTLKVEADVERHVVSTGPDNCFDFYAGDGPVNCTRSGQGLEWWLALTGQPDPDPDAGGIELFDEPTRDQPDPFPDCPGAPFPDMAFSLNPPAWGSLLESGAHVSPSKLFNPQVKRIRISPSEEESDSKEPPLYPYSSKYVRSLSYTVSLKRVAKK